MLYKFTNPETKEIEEVEPVRWRWIACYKDGKILKQYDDDGTFHQFREIVKHNSQVLYFSMVSDQSPHGYKLAIPTGADIIHFYRNTRLAGETVFKRHFMFGWKILLNGKVHKRLICIRPDDTIALLDDDGR